MKKNSSRVHYSRQCNDMDNYLRTREFEVMILIHCHTFGEWTYWNPDCNAWKMNAMTFIFQPTTQNLGPKLRNIFMLLRLWRKSSWEWHYFFHSCQVILVIKSWNDVDKRTITLHFQNTVKILLCIPSYLHTYSVSNTVIPKMYRKFKSNPYIKMKRSFNLDIL